MADGEFFSKKRMLARNTQLRSLRAPHLADWQKITQVIRPNRGRYLTGDAGDKEESKRPTSMVNSTPAVASRVLRAGMIAGASSPAYEWFKLVLDDEEMMKWGPARLALEHREKVLRAYLAQSNFYQILETIYGDGADFGTGAGIIDVHPREAFTLRCWSPGEYTIDVDETGDIDTYYVETSRTTLQLISRFGRAKVSEKVREAYDRGDYNTSFPILQVIEPNQDIQSGLSTWRGKPWTKFIFEKAVTEEGEGKYLEISGYNDWPGVNLRWNISSGNIWGDGPGLLALGDAAALQTLEFRDAQAVEKAVKPPLRAPIFLKNKVVNQAPGGVTYYDPFTANQANVEPLYQMQAGVLQAISTKIEKAEFRVNEVYYKDLFLMLASTDRREITAREVEEKHQEKLLGLGPVLQRTHRDALTNAIIRIYRILDEGGAFRPAPRELSERMLRLRYTSALAYAQRAAGASSLERFFGFTGNISAAYPSVRHKVDINAGMDYYADAIGVPAEIMVPTDKALAASQAEAQAAAAPAQAAAGRDIAAGAELLSRTDTARPSALSFLMQRGGLA